MSVCDILRNEGNAGLIPGGRSPRPLSNPQSFAAVGQAGPWKDFNMAAPQQCRLSGGKADRLGDPGWGTCSGGESPSDARKPAGALVDPPGVRGVSVLADFRGFPGRERRRISVGGHRVITHAIDGVTISNRTIPRRPHSPRGLLSRDCSDCFAQMPFSFPLREEGT